MNAKIKFIILYAGYSDTRWYTLINGITHENVIAFTFVDNKIFHLFLLLRYKEQLKTERLDWPLRWVDKPGKIVCFCFDTKKRINHWVFDEICWCIIVAHVSHQNICMCANSVLYKSECNRNTCVMYLTFFWSYQTGDGFCCLLFLQTPASFRHN